MADSKLTAYAEGGPAAAQDYEAAKSDTSAIKQQALSDAANRSGAAYAPSEFRAQQSQMIGAPLDASIGALGRMGGAAGAYSGALDASKNAYLGDVQASQSLVQQVLASQATHDYAKALNDVGGLIGRQDAATAREGAANEKAKKANDQRNEDFNKSAKTFALQDAAIDKSMDTGTLEALHDLTKFSSLDEALATLDRSRDNNGVVQYQDGQGNPVAVNEQLLQHYLVSAYGNDQPGTAGVLTGDNAAEFKQLYGG